MNAVAAKQHMPTPTQGEAITVVMRGSFPSHGEEERPRRWSIVQTRVLSVADFQRTLRERQLRFFSVLELHEFSEELGRGTISVFPKECGDVIECITPLTDPGLPPFCISRLRVTHIRQVSDGLYLQGSALINATAPAACFLVRNAED